MGPSTLDEFKSEILDRSFNIWFDMVQRHQFKWKEVENFILKTTKNGVTIIDIDEFFKEQQESIKNVINSHESEAMEETNENVVKSMLMN